ncbi:hypothetical protein GCM10022393_00600 [Aquimarina addita]|uniref:Uncharacterized protein n=1 Tax=Aquimarina addita TaxID=870485 RepID=A0ABP7X708_9FLAO
MIEAFKTIAVITSLLFTSILLSQEKKRDTLFFKYDKNYLITSKVSKDSYLIKDGYYNKGGLFFFDKKQDHYNLQPEKVLKFKKFIRSSKLFYNKKKTRKLNNRKLLNYLTDYVVIFVTKEDAKIKFIEMNTGIEIE